MKKLTATIVAILALGGLLGGCAGLDANTATTTIINSGATGASALLPEAQAGTLSLSDALAVLVNVGEQAKLLHGQLVGTTGLTYLFSPQAHGLLVTDPAYVPVLNELLANMLASEDRALGAWSVTAPTQAYANAQAAQALKALLVIQAMQQDKTSQTVSLKYRPPARRLVATTTPSLQNIISAIPGWQAAYNKLPANVQALVNQDLPIVATWAEDQIAQWWADYVAGDTVAARQQVLDSVSDADLQTDFTAANQTAVTAIATHVAQELAFVNGVKDFALAIIPAILSEFGL